MGTDTLAAVGDYFRAKRRELIALGELAVVNHAGLKGGHREQIYRVFLADLLPRRYSVGRGMVYGLFHRSREADIVIWDSLSYPSLPLHDHALFFAESARAVLECKSVYSAEHFIDALAKSQAVRDIVPHNEPSLADELAQIQLEIVSLKAGTPHHGLLIAGHHIATAVMFLKGGQSVEPEALLRSCAAGLDDSWPDILLFLEPGLLALKLYAEDAGHGIIVFHSLGEDALLGFSSSLLKVLDDRVVHSEGRFYFDRYASPLLSREPLFTQEFRLSRPAPGRSALWG